jgi:hypothetical protein
VHFSCLIKKSKQEKQKEANKSKRKLKAKEMECLPAAHVPGGTLD